MDVRLFPFIQADHPFAPQVERFRAAVQAGPLERLADAEGTTVHAEIKAVPGPDGGWALDRFYWSLQGRDPAARFGFAALTLLYSASTGQLEWHAFPEDPYLPTLAAALGEGDSVLRYVPLRRVTLRTADAIGKVKRRSKLLEGYQRLTSVWRGVASSSVSFDVAAPLGLDEARSVFFQTAQPGQNLAHLLNETNAAALLQRVGAMHRELHELHIRDLPTQDTTGLLDEVQRDVRWIAFCQPDCAALVEATWDLLRRHAPRVDPDAYTVCHGDFVCSQVLVAAERWSVTDFDLAHQGDPYRDIAILLTSLTYDVPVFETGQAPIEAADEAYLAGYEARAGQPLDRARLAWHRLAAEIYYLALMLKKDWYQPTAFSRALERFGALGSQLRD